MARGEWMRLALSAFEAGSNPGLWPSFLQEYARLISADIALFQIHKYAQHRSEIIAAYGLKSVFRDSYNEYYSRINVWREHGNRLYSQGRVLIDKEVYPRQLLERSEFYNDCLVPFGGVHSLAGVLNRDKNSGLVLTGLRDVQRNPWEISDKREVEFLSPHVTRAFSLQRKLWIFQAGEIVLNSIALGVVLFASNERAVYTNQTAEAIFRENDGIELKAGALTAIDAAASASIQAAIRNAARMDLAQFSTDALLVERKSMRRPYQIIVLPVRRNFRQFAGMGAPAVLVLITDPERQMPAAADLMRKLYGLTAKEAELAEKLSLGMSPEEAANDLNIQYETARTHLKHIYSKMGISRQNELVALIARLPRPPVE